MKGFVIATTTALALLLAPLLLRAAQAQRAGPIQAPNEAQAQEEFHALRGLDQNFDNKISLQEWSRYHTAYFAAMDANSDMMLDLDEQRDIARHWEHLDEATQERVAAALQPVDRHPSAQ
jgi:hypothetical protein